jgi:RNA polymerase sigma factor (sigma-70 family)
MDGRQRLDRLVGRLRLAAIDPGGGELSDGQLLQRFRRDCDPAAFEQLMRRHGRVVLLACRRQLREPHDVEDCFQAVWLILARKAGSIRRPELLASWLYGVARHTAIQARASDARRRARELQAARPEAVPPDARAEWWEALDRELSRLPEAYRIAVLLCDVEGIDYKEAARRLGWPAGTLAGRLARARRLLSRRLARHGIVLTVATVAQELAAPADAAVAAALAAGTGGSAVLVAGAPGRLAELASSQAMQLAQEVLHIMHLTKLKIVAAVLMTAVVAGLGGSLVPWVGRGGPGTEARAQDGAGADAAGQGQAAEPARQPRPEDKLAAIVSVDFKDEPLEKALEHLRKQTGLNIVADWKELNDQGVTKDQPITLHLDKVRARTVLRNLERSIGLSYYFEDGVMTVTTQEVADNKMLRRVYPVADLVGSDAKGENLIEVVLRIIGPNPQLQLSSAAVAYFAEGRSLVVVHSMRGHEEITELLEELRATRPSQKAR